jgi:predicted amidohydrolase
MSAVRAAAVQFTGVPLEAACNTAAIETHVRLAADEGARLVVLPELSHSGYTLSPRLRLTTGALAGRSTEFLSRLTRELDITIVTTVAAVDHGDHGDRALRNVGLIVTPDGIAASGAKRGLWGDEPTLFSPGEPNEQIIADTPVGRVGVAICYEAGFPEVARRLALAGADIIAVPAAFGAARLHAWKLMTRSRALENGCYLVAANAFGTSAGLEFCGHTTIVDPHGHRLAVLPDGEGRVIADLDTTEIAAARSAIPYLRDLDAIGAPSNHTDEGVVDVRSASR